ncbi:MAG: nucleotidyltransferase family protein [Alphaproteobacteria bacterium]
MSAAAIVLAAGSAQRFGADKLLQIFEGKPLIAHAIAAAAAAPVERVVVVKRPGAALDSVVAVARAQDSRVTTIDVGSAALSASLRAGLGAVRGAANVFVFLGDMPLVSPDMARLLAERLEGHFAAVPMCGARPGHPVLLSARAVSLAANLTGDHGAGVLLRAHKDDVITIETGDERVVFDVDTPNDLESLRRRGKS